MTWREKALQRSGHHHEQ
ncbi:hypothetical protein [Enterobacter kobei]